MHRLLPEWVAQSAVLLAWPDEQTDWSPCLDEVRKDYRRLIAAISAHETVLVLVRDASAAEELHDCIGIDLRNQVLSVVTEYNDTWTRDFGPLSVAGTAGTKLADFVFDGWGGKYPADLDNTVTRRLHAAGVFGGITIEHHGQVLEGGAVETDGAGTALCNRDTFRARDRAFSAQTAENWLRETLGLDRLLWLEGIQLQGDDTDGHVDTLARFAGPGDIVYQSCTDSADEHYGMFRQLRSRLEGFRTREGEPYALHALPWPPPLFDQDRRLPASYANFLIINGAVLVPAFGVPADELARRVIAQAFPDREAIGVPSTALLRQFGGIHCVTMQLPASVEIQIPHTFE